jgi:hypothetical protein
LLRDQLKEECRTSRSVKAVCRSDVRFYKLEDEQSCSRFARWATEKKRKSG